jgi:cytochrome c-type biogenesis protein CcmF
MIAELGHFALILALCTACVQVFFPIAGAASGNITWMAIAFPAARTQLLLLIFAFISLVYAFVNNDFSLVYVASNSNSMLPVAYKISAVWGAHEGSLLLWILILAIWTTAVTFFSRNLPAVFVSRVVGIMGLISIGFLLFILLTSNPFWRQIPAAEGVDLNPLLQDPGLIIHPPVLYMGYVGFSVAFSFAIAALLSGQLDAAWARWSRPWTITAWIFLTLGIALGSWWAYYELGWGGWWFWDPVENASFMPWLVGTALIHSLAATDKRGTFKNWTVLLSITVFALSLLGTFLVRSGVLTSVHAFANDPARGIFILCFLGLVIGGSLTLYAWRAPGIVTENNFQPLSRETFLLINSTLLVVVMASILLGTLYPLVIDALDLGKLSVGAPYFNFIFVPFMSLLVIVLGLGQLTRWQSDTVERLWQHLRYAFFASVIFAILIMIMLAGKQGQTLKAGLGICLAVWVLMSILVTVRARLRSGTNFLTGLSNLPRAFKGMCLAHLGLAVTIIGITLSSLYSNEVHKRMMPGDQVELSGYIFQFTSLHDIDGPNYQATEAVINVFRNKKPVADLRTQKRIYTARNMPMTEAGIDPGFTRDLYVSLGEPLGKNEWSIRLYYKPFVRWIWLGAILMALGGILAISDARYRIETRRVKYPVEFKFPGQALSKASS